MDEIEVMGETIHSVQRRFLRSSEDKRVEAEGFQILHAPKTCTGCRNTVLSVIFDLKNSDQLEYLSGLTLISGPEVDVPPDIPPESIIAVGVCVPEDQRGDRFVTGCPPNNVAVVQEILGGQVQVSRTYSTDGEAGEDKA